MTLPRPVGYLLPLVSGKKAFVMKTTLADENEIVRTWFVVDATDKPVGRLAAKVAHILRGKTKAIYTPHIDTGDFVVVLNAAKVKLTGRKEDQKTYDTFSRFPGGLKVTPAHRIRQTKPDLIIYNAVKGMLPKNHMSRKILKRLLVYAGAEHPHQAQKPQVLDL